MTFVESMELCSYGAKVIYPPTIYPVFHKNIPIRILNTFNPTAPGTFISESCEGDGRVRGVSVLGKTGVINIKGSLTSNFAELNTRAYNALSRNGVSVLLVGHPGENADFPIVVPENEVEKGLGLLESEFSQELREGDVETIAGDKEMSIVAVVGESIKKIVGLGARLVNTLWRNGIEVKAVSDGVSETTIAIVVRSADASRALALIHEAAI